MEQAVREQLVRGERVLRVAGRVLVASRSQAGLWWDVTDGACSCPAWRWRGRCRHAEVLRPPPKAA